LQINRTVGATSEDKHVTVIFKRSKPRDVLVVRFAL